MISEEVFVSVIERLRQQYLQDKEYVDGLNSLYGVDDMKFYDNDNLIKSCFELLRIWFPVDSDGHCDIEHYCYVCDFGKVGDIGDSAALYSYLRSKLPTDSVWKFSPTDENNIGFLHDLSNPKPLGI